MGARKDAFKPDPAGLRIAAGKLRDAYRRVVEAESHLLGYAAYAEVHGIASRIGHALERVGKSEEMSRLARKK